MNGFWVERGLGLRTGELGRLLPFFFLYFLLFTALTLADGVAVALFVSRLGAEHLPKWYAVTAFLSLGILSVYLTFVRRFGSAALFHAILGFLVAGFFLAWITCLLGGGALAFGGLFVLRELAMTLILMHFGTFLQEYFVRLELNRVLPIVYAGGRLGGILGGLLLSEMTVRLGTLNLVPLLTGILVVGWVAMAFLAHRCQRREEPTEPKAPGTHPPTPSGGQPAASPEARRDRPVAWEGWTASGRDFLKQIAATPLLIWLTTCTLLFVGCRWFLAYQYTAYFEQHFENEEDLARFLGRYTQVALGVSLLLQLFLVNRLVRWMGVPMAYLSYCFCLFAGLLGNLLGVGLPLAVASRFVETEFRFGFRNPVNQMVINRFPRQTRIVVRAWSLGWLIPVGTLLTSGVIGGLLRWGNPHALSLCGVVLGVGLLFGGFRLGQAYRRHPE